MREKLSGQRKRVWLPACTNDQRFKVLSCRWVAVNREHRLAGARAATARTYRPDFVCCVHVRPPQTGVFRSLRPSNCEEVWGRRTRLRKPLTGPGVDSLGAD